MAVDRIARRNKLQEELSELRNNALSALERLGYEVRGKTPGEIRLMLKRRRTKHKSKVQRAEKEPTVPTALPLDNSACLTSRVNLGSELEPTLSNPSCACVDTGVEMIGLEQPTM